MGFWIFCMLPCSWQVLSVWSIAVAALQLNMVRTIDFGCFTVVVDSNVYCAATRAVLQYPRALRPFPFGTVEALLPRRCDADASTALLLAPMEGTMEDAAGPVEGAKEPPLSWLLPTTSRSVVARCVLLAGWMHAHQHTHDYRQ